MTKMEQVEITSEIAHLTSTVIEHFVPVTSEWNSEKLILSWHKKDWKKKNSAEVMPNGSPKVLISMGIKHFGITRQSSLQ